MDASREYDFNSLKVIVAEENDVCKVAFIGQIDENFEYNKILLPDDMNIEFNLEKISLYNSCGIRNWLFFIREFPKHQKIKFKKCSIGVIDQINMIPNSIGQAEVESFFAPYFCDNCEAGESDQLIIKENHLEDLTNKKSPKFECKSCSEPLDFDALEDSYFDFLQLEPIKKSA